MAANPFDRVNLGYEGLFGPRTRFVHVPPAPPKVSAAEKGFTQFAGEKVKGEGTLVEWIDVPVLDLRGAGWVEVVTVGAVVVAFLGLCWALFARGGEKKVDKGKKKQ